MQSSKYNDYRENLIVYCGRSAAHAIPAIILGYLVDEICRKIQVQFKLRPFTMVIIQLIIVILIMCMTERFLFKRYNKGWTGKTPSVLFTSFFFLMQVTLFKNLIQIKESMSFIKE